METKPFSVKSENIQRDGFRLSSKGTHYWKRVLRDGNEITYIISVEEFDKEDGLVMGSMIVSAVEQLDSI